MRMESMVLLGHCIGVLFACQIVTRHCQQERGATDALSALLAYRCATGRRARQVEA